LRLNFDEERLRKERRDRTEVVISIVDPVGVKPDLAVIEVEVRRVAELAIGARKIAFAHP